jgi:AcrR family transcriptional regulator
MTAAATDLAGAPGPFAAPDPRTRLLAATIALVAEHGYAAAEPALIAAAAGVPAPGFHRYFADREAAALAAHDCALAWLEESLAPAPIAGDLDWPRRVRATVEQALDLLAPFPDLTCFCAWEFPRSGPTARASHRAIVDRLAAALRTGRVESPWGADLPAHTERIAIGGAVSMLGQRARRGEGTRLPSLAPEITYFLIVPYLGIPAARRTILDEDSSPAPSWSRR